MDTCTKQCFLNKILMSLNFHIFYNTATKKIFALIDHITSREWSSKIWVRPLFHCLKYSTCSSLPVWHSVVVDHVVEHNTDWRQMFIFLINWNFAMILQSPIQWFLLQALKNIYNNYILGTKTCKLSVKMTTGFFSLELHHGLRFFTLFHTTEFTSFSSNKVY